MFVEYEMCTHRDVPVRVQSAMGVHCKFSTSATPDTLGWLGPTHLDRAWNRTQRGSRENTRKQNKKLAVTDHFEY